MWTVTGEYFNGWETVSETFCGFLHMYVHNKFVFRCVDCNVLLSSEEEGRGCYPLDNVVLCKVEMNDIFY